jgi:hypothetical protein
MHCNMAFHTLYPKLVSCKDEVSALEEALTVAKDRLDRLLEEYTTLRPRLVFHLHPDVNFAILGLLSQRTAGRAAAVCRGGPQMLADPIPLI